MNNFTKQVNHNLAMTYANLNSNIVLLQQCGEGYSETVIRSVKRDLCPLFHVERHVVTEIQLVSFSTPLALELGLVEETSEQVFLSAWLEPITFAGEDDDLLDLDY